MRHTWTKSRRVIAAVLVASLIAMGLSVGFSVGTASAAPVLQRSAEVVTADVLPTVQIDDGVVWAQTIRGNVVYAGGDFDNARPAGAAPGTSLTPRGNLLAYDLTSGSLITGFAPSFNGQVKSLALSPDGSRLYVGGAFTIANGATRFNLAAVDPVTGSLIDAFKPAAGGSYVNAIAVSSSTVFVGGLLGAGNGVARKNLMAFRASDGRLLDWAPTTDLQVDTMVLTPMGKVIVGGRFGTVNGVGQRGMAALDPVSGSLLPWAAPQTVQNGVGSGTYAGRAGIYSLSTDGVSVFGTGWVYANTTVGNLEGSFKADAESGVIQWLEDCHGDTYGSYSDRDAADPNGGYVYEIGHKHDCVTLGGFPQKNPAPGNLRHAVVFTNATQGTLTRSPSTGNTYKDWSGQPSPAMVNWAPEWTTGSFTGQGQAAWTVTGNGDYVVFGGEFPFVNGQRQQGLVRFAKPNIAPRKEGPRLSGANWMPTLTSFAPGKVRISFASNWDRDDMNLTYRVVRDGVPVSALTTTAPSTFWNTPSIALTDGGLTPGRSYTYQVLASDPDGNQVSSATGQVAVTTRTDSTYSASVSSRNPSLYWRLGESAGAVAFDWVGTNDGAVRGAVSRSVAGAIAGDPDAATGFNGISSQTVNSQSPIAAPNVFSIQAWFKTATTTGGKIVSFGSAPSGSSASHDRSIYMQNNGQLRFGVYNGQAQTVVSPAGYRDDRWHHVVGTLGTTGLRLYVDGQLVAANPAVTSGQAYNGYWRVGGDTVGSWPGAPSSGYFAGSVDEVAIYPTTLTAQQVADSQVLAQSNAAPAPTAAFASRVDALSVDFDGSGSRAANGQTITAYSWDFGDGSPKGNGSSVTHGYAQAGTYQATLTVTDGRGVSGSVTKAVTVSEPHAPPVAGFTATTDPLSVSVDGGGSTASGGATVVGWVWDFGDGNSGQGRTDQHTYAAAGSYTVKLTVTDSRGATASTTRTVEIPGLPAVFAADAFERSQDPGWGAADVGGPWSGSTGYTAAGGAGRVTVASAQTRQTLLTSVSARDVDATMQVSVNAVPNGGGLHSSFLVRRGTTPIETTTSDYRIKLRYQANGSVIVSLSKVVGSTETYLANATFTGYSAGQTVNVRVQAVGASPTQLRGKVWLSGTTEPTSWLVSATDGQSELQNAGQIGQATFLSGTTTNGPVVASIDNLRVVPTQ